MTSVLDRIKELLEKLYELKNIGAIKIKIEAEGI